MKDITARSNAGSSHTVRYHCQIHGQYRHYEDELMQYKVRINTLISFCMLGKFACFQSVKQFELSGSKLLQRLSVGVKFATTGEN